MREIKTDKRSYEEIKIGGRAYKLDLSDEALDRHSRKFPEMAREIGALEAAGSLDVQTFKVFLKDAINWLYLDEPFEAISEGCGGNAAAIARVFNESAQALREILAGAKGRD